MVVPVAGAAVKNNKGLLDGRWDKNDTKDAANIADLMCWGSASSTIILRRGYGSPEGF
ncbi:MAG: transposase family protein [Deltaproteobacteria bacterium]|nr:transposase family protein [Deltaproteobacteria bacterium]